MAGPENPGDVIMLVPAGSPELARGNYVYAGGFHNPMRALIALGPQSCAMSTRVAAPSWDARPSP